MCKVRTFSGLFILLMGILLFSLVYGQTESPPPPLTLEVTGRLASEKHGEAEQLVLHAKDTQTYFIKGALQGKLKGVFQDLGKNNLVALFGRRDERNGVSCSRQAKYIYNEKGQKVLNVEVICIPYYNLEVTQILLAEKSDEEIPPPKRDVEEERRFIMGVQQQTLIPPVTGEIYGKIRQVNLKSPIKTVEIENRDKNSPLNKLILVISPDTRIVKKMEKEEPMPLSARSLKVGQEVTAIYSRSELKSEAIAITITKE